MSYEPATMLGMGIGDALGAPFEQPSSATEPPPGLADWTGEFRDTHGAYGAFQAGEWTDDTGMGVALSRALLERRAFTADNVMRHYFNWYETVPKGLVGGTIKKAMANYGEGSLAANCGILGSEGNGAAMRCAPIGVFFWRDIEAAMDIAREEATLTHRSLEAEEGSAAVAGASAFLVYMRMTYGKDCVLDALPSAMMLSIADHLRESKIKDLLKSLLESPTTDLQATLKRIGTKGHVLQTVPAAFACFLFTKSFEEAVMAAVRGAGDADTTAAITGALAGTFYGREGIPERWRAGVHRGDYLHTLDQRLFHEAYRPGPSTKGWG